MKSKLAAVAAALLTTACSTVGVRSGTEEPAFTEVERIGDIQVRTYGERIAAETMVTGSSEAARNRGFQKLAGYIFGGNAARTSIAMTAPVPERQAARLTTPASIQRRAAFWASAISSCSISWLISRR